MFGTYDGSQYTGWDIEFNNNDQIDIHYYNGSSYVVRRTTNAYYRDPSAWYSIVVSVDLNIVGNDQVKLFVNGEQVTSFATTTNANIDTNIGDVENRIGYNYSYSDFFLAEVNFIDGQALSCDEFGFFDGQGLWMPKRFTGDYASSSTPDTTDDVYAWGLTFDNVTGGGGWYFTTEDDASSLGLPNNTGGHADELGGNTIGQRNGESTAGAWGTIASLNGYTAGQGARSMSTNTDMGTTGNAGGPISFVWNKTNGKVWVIGNGDSSPIGGGDPNNHSSTPTFLLPTTGKVAFGFVSGNSTETVTLQAISSSLFSGSHTLPKWRGVYDHTLSNNNATSTATSGGYRDVWSDELNDNSTAPAVGRNSFKLDFSDNSSASALAKDKSGRGNDFTPYNITAKVYEIASPNNPGWSNPGGNWTLSNQDSNSRYQNANYSGSNTYSSLIAGALANNTTYHFFLEQYAGSNDSYGGWFISDSQSVSSTVPDELGSNTLGLRVGETGLGVHGTYATANSVTAGQDAITGFDSIRANVSTGAATFTEFVINTTVDKVWVRPVGGDWIGGGDPSNTSSTPSFSLITSNPQYFGYMAYNSGTYAHITPTAGNPVDVDCLNDSPVNGNEASTGAGGERRGNYCCFNPLDKHSSLTISDGSLKVQASTTQWELARSTFLLSSGKHYWEFTWTGSVTSSSGVQMGLKTPESTLSAAAAQAGSYAFQYTTIYGTAGTPNSVVISPGSTTSGDTVMFAYDADAGKMWLGVNGTWNGSGNPSTGSNPDWTDLPKTGLSPFPPRHSAQKMT